MTTGKKNSTLRKKTPKESKLLATGVKSIKFWHEATAGDTSIPFGSLNLPADILTAGLLNPTGTDLLNSNLALFHNNVEVHSSLNQKLMEGLTYVVKNNQITFVNGYEASEGEIFEVNYKNDTVVGTSVVDARPIRATGTLVIGQTDFNVGEAFETNKFPATQLGAVKVFMDGVLQLRNVGNATAAPAADGNYEEVHSTGGFGVIIRFNNSFGSDKVIVVTSEYLVEKPDISQLQLIDSLAGTVDKLVEVVAQDTGNDESVFQAAPNNVDLKAFGDKVTDLELNKKDEFSIEWQKKTLTAIANSVGTVAELTFNSLEIGKTYRITLQVHHFNSSNQSSSIEMTNDGNVIVQSQRDPDSSTPDRQTWGTSGVFTATATTLVADVISAGANGYLENTNTWAILEELPNHVLTGKWA